MKNSKTKKQPRVCQACNKEFTPKRKTSIVCDQKCLNVWRSRRYKGRKFSEEHKQNMLNAKLRENVRKEGHYPCERCKKMFESNTALRSHKSYCSSPGEPKNVTCKTCGKTFKRQRGLIWHMKSHDTNYLKEHIRKTKEGLKNRPPQKSTSTVEITFHKKLIEIYGSEVKHKFRDDRINHEFDFYVPSKNLIIEFDGDYWHGNSALHNITEQMKIQFNIDRSFTQAARDLGYIVERVWASESDEYPTATRAF